MGLDDVSKYTITLKRCGEGLIIKTCSISEDVLETAYKYQLSSLFALLEEGKFKTIQPCLRKITSLDLSNCDLSELPKCIKILHLKKFNISNNKFTQVPSCLFGNGLHELENLDMSQNKLTQFDIEPDCVLSLKQLKLNNNCFQNVPKWFLTFRCTNLEELNYSENQATHYNFLKHSCNLNFMKLKKLELRNSCLLGKDITWIKCFKNLKHLDISNKSLICDINYINRIKELDELFVRPCWKALEVLKLNFLDISFFPEGVFWIESLKELYISNNLLSWLPDGLEYLVNLQVLDISNNELVYISKQISQLVKLKTLFAAGNQLEEVPIMPDGIEVLDLYDNCIEVVDNENLEQLKILDLELNCIDLEVVLNGYHEIYCNKRDMFRNLYNNENRSTGFKLREVCNSSSSSERADTDNSDYECYNSIDADLVNSDNNIHKKSIEILDEDWDGESTKTPAFRHPDISLSDHEYNGEKDIVFQQNFNKMRRVYDDDEDFMFVDAD